MISARLYFLPLAFAMLLTVLSAVSCGPGNASGPSEQASSVQAEDIESDDSLDWSTVQAEDLWNGVFQLYETDGPNLAVLLLDRGLENGVVTHAEAEQVRAGFLYELGRLDEAFLALAHYRLDAEHPDLLKLRAEVLWGMSRYDEARRDYEMLLDASTEETPYEILYALARLYDDLGEWDLARSVRDQLGASDPHPLSMLLALYDAIQSENPGAIRSVGGHLVDPEDGEVSAYPMVAFASAYLSLLEGNADKAEVTIQTYMQEQGFDLNLESLLLRIYSETGNFTAFEAEYRASLEILRASRWLEVMETGYPLRPDNPRAAAGLLDSASALELGRGDREMARMYAERARILNPYDYVAALQLAAVEIAETNIETSFGLLNEAVRLAPPSDVRTRLRLIQFAPMAIPQSGETLWDEDTIVSELQDNLDHWISRYPANSYYNAAQGELAGYKGNISRALEYYTAATTLPGATRETWFRYAYWLARDGRMDDAREVAFAHLPAGAPYLTWATMLVAEAEATSNPGLAEFASEIVSRLDPANEHAEFFESPIGE